MTHLEKDMERAMHKSLFDATRESMEAMMKMIRENNVSPEYSMNLALWNIAFALADIADSLRDPDDEENGQ